MASWSVIKSRDIRTFWHILLRSDSIILYIKQKSQTDFVAFLLEPPTGYKTKKDSQQIDNLLEAEAGRSHWRRQLVCLSLFGDVTLGSPPANCHASQQTHSVGPSPSLLLPLSAHLSVCVFATDFFLFSYSVSIN